VGRERLYVYIYIYRERERVVSVNGGAATSTNEMPLQYLMMIRYEAATPKHLMLTATSTMMGK
jgi:hypothetical protein